MYYFIVIVLIDLKNPTDKASKSSASNNRIIQHLSHLRRLILRAVRPNNVATDIGVVIAGAVIVD